MEEASQPQQRQAKKTKGQPVKQKPALPEETLVEN